MQDVYYVTRATYSIFAIEFFQVSCDDTCMSLAKYYLLFLLSLSTLAADLSDNATLFAEKIKHTISCPGSINEALKQGEYKAAINELTQLIQKKPTAELYLTLAVCQLRDQQEEEAFKSYTICLEKAYSSQNTNMSAREHACYDELLALYFANSEDLQTKLASVLERHPDFIMCQFFLASSCANARRYEPFFYIFYQAYCNYPDTHMSHKTQGVIASLIFQRAKAQEEKNVWRKKAINSFIASMKLCPEDMGLHKMLIHTATDTERKDVVKLVLGQVMQNDSKLPRTEIPFYINHALWVGEVELAQRLLDKAKTWYEYSRIIQEMQDLIGQKKADE